ncbi:MAG TPA: hypothetical protein VKR21_17100 [Solirubrobacteraceae bacterium]|nr:hypothetical protein [Solirubrobacteraceae bacterium]
MKPRRRAVALSTVWIAAVGLMLLALVEALPKGFVDTAYAAFATLLVVSTVGAGAILVARLPRHIVGWLLLVGGLSMAASTVAQAVADYGLNEHPGSVPGAVWFAVLSNATSAYFVGLLGGFTPVFFPTGRLPSPRWRVVVILGLIATISLVFSSLFGPFAVGDYPAGVANPLAVGGVAGSFIAQLGTAGNLVGVIAFICVIASLVVRYRRAQGVERAQIKWFAHVGLVVVPLLVLGIMTGSVSSGPLAAISELAWLCAIAGLALLPVTIGIAVLRYHLYEIDRLISRTISWALISVLVVGLFAGCVLALQALMAPYLRSNELAVAGSTLLVFGLFQPIRRRVQALVDRRFNRARYDAEATVAAFASRLRDEVDLDQLQAEVLATVRQTVEPSSVSLWLRE